MLLALWFDFWNPAAWVAGPPPVIPPVPPSSGGHGHRQNIKEWDRAGDAYWEAKAEMMRRLMPQQPAQNAPPAVKKLVKRQERLVNLIPFAENIKQLQKIEDRILDISIRVQEFDVYSDEDALLALLLS